MNAGSPHVDAVLSQVMDVARIEQRHVGYKYGELNLLGNLLIVALNGRALLDLNGAQFRLAPGSVAWLLESEWLRLTVLTAPWTYLQVRFSVRGLPILPHDGRVRNPGKSILPLCRELLSAWKEPGGFAWHTLLVGGLVGQMLGRLLRSTQALAPAPSVHASIWWRAESEARKDLARHLTLADLCVAADTNRVALERAAKETTGMTPIRRLRQVRLQQAQTLMCNKLLSIKEIALMLGYAHIQDFSRDYRKAFGLSPRQSRRQLNR